VTDTGISLTGPTTSIELNAATVSINSSGITSVNGGIVALACGTGGGGLPVARETDLVLLADPNAVVGTIDASTIRVFAC
jgi:hypothetical protein